MNFDRGAGRRQPARRWLVLVAAVAFCAFSFAAARAATLEPLRQHLAAYGAHLAQNFASGVQACYRGPCLYDSEETKALVKRWVDFYKRYRAILDSDIVHVRRPDGRDLDMILHVNPRLPEKG